MSGAGRRTYVLEIVGFAAAAVILSRFELFAIAFLIPVQLAWIRHGEQAGTASSGLAAAALLVVSAVGARQIGSTGGGSIGAGAYFVDAVVAVVFLAGLFLMNSRRAVAVVGRPLLVAERAAAAAILAVAIFGVFAVLAGPSLWADYFAVQLARRPELLLQVDATQEELIALQQQVLPVIARGALPAYLAILLGNWWIGSLVAFRTRFPLAGGNPVMQEIAGYSVVQFQLPVAWVWVLITAWSAVAAAIVLELEWMTTIAWNAALTIMVLYAIQGIAVALHLSRSRAGDQRVRLLIAGGLVLGLLIPGVRIVIAVGIPMLGVSEIWISYHRFEGSEESDEGNS